MPYADSLISTAHKLAAAPPKKPRRSDLNRAVSTAYYAVFDALCTCCARALAGSSSQPTPSDTWATVYRSVGHEEARRLLQGAVKLRAFGNEIAQFAADFLMLQSNRHGADYDPCYRVSRADARRMVAAAGDAIARLKSASTSEKQKLAVALLVKTRTR